MKKQELPNKYINGTAYFFNTLLRTQGIKNEQNICYYYL